jgi:hypothetical protein
MKSSERVADKMRLHFNTFSILTSAAAIAMGSFGCVDNGRDLTDAATTSESIKDADLRLLDLSGNPFDLWHAGPGNIRVVLFTRSDCPISNRYAPDVRRLHESFHTQGVDFYLIYVDPKEQPDAIRRHLEEFEYPFPALRDPEHTLVSHTGATVTPEAVVFDRDGRITYRGRIDDRYLELGNARAVSTTNDLRDAIEATLAGQTIAEPFTKAVGCYIGDLE